MSRRLLPLLVLSLLAGPARADDGYLRFLPSDTKVVGVINVPSLNEDARKAAADMVRALYAEQMVAELKKLIKLPISELDQIVFAQPALGGFNGVVILRGKVDAKLLDEQLGAAMKNDKALKSERVGDPAVTVYRRELAEEKFLALAPELKDVPALARSLIVPSHAYIAALDERTLCVALGPRVGAGRVMERAVRARPEKSEPRTADEMTKLLKGRDSKDLLTAVVLERCLHPGLELVAPAGVKETFERFDSVLVRLRADENVRLTFEVTAKSKADAEKLEQTAKAVIENVRKGLGRAVPDEGQRKIVEAMVKAFTVARKDATVTAEGKLDVSEAKKLIPKPDRK